MLTPAESGAERLVERLPAVYVCLYDLFHRQGDMVRYADIGLWQNFPNDFHNEASSSWNRKNNDATIATQRTKVMASAGA